MEGTRRTLRRFAQVGLPPGAIVDGEVVQVAPVAEALRRLWEEGRFSSRRVIVGLSSQRVIVRRAEVPQMTPEDFRLALRFEAQDLLPIAIDEAALDFSIVDRASSTDAATGATKMEILLAAAHLDVVRSHLAALKAAGLHADAVDVVPLGLLRGLGPSTGPDALEAVVSVGADLLTVAIRQGNTPCFTRTVNMGGSKITNSLAAQLNLTAPEAEALKRAPQYDGQLLTEDRVRTLVYDEVRPLLAEICSSLDFFQAQGDGRTIDRVLLTGGGALTKGLQLGLAGAMGNASLALADPFARLTMSPELVFTDRQRYEASTQALTPIGLALWGAEPALRRVNLLPPEIAVARRRRTAIQISAVALTALAVALAGAVVLRDRQVDHANQAVTQIDQSNAVLQERVTSLSGATALKSEVEARRALAASALSTDIAFVPLLQEVSAALPAHDWVSSISIQVTAASASASSTTESQGLGTLQMGLSGLDGHESVAEWLRAAAQIPDLNNVWVGASATSSSGADSFSTSANVTQAAQSTRAQKLPGAP